MLRKWQRILRLQDWRIELGKLGVNPAKGGIASVDGLNQYKQATIFLGTGAFESCNGPIEETIVHELLHLHFNTWEEKNLSKAATMNMEQVINILSEVLVGRKKL